MGAMARAASAAEKKARPAAQIPILRSMTADAATCSGRRVQWTASASQRSFTIHDSPASLSGEKQTPLFRYDVGNEISSARSLVAGHPRAAMMVLGARRWTARTVVPNVKNGVADVTIGLGELKDSVLDGFEGIHAWGAIFDRSQRQQCAPEKATSRESLPHFGEWQAQGRAKTVGDGEHPKSSGSGPLRDSTNMRPRLRQA